MIICAIYDKKAKTYDTPYFLPNAVIATRAFENQMKNEQIQKFAGDFELHQLGEFEPNEIKFDQETGKMKVTKQWKLTEKFVKLADGVAYANLPLQEETKK